jgi:niacin transporter
MSNNTESRISLGKPTLPLSGLRAYGFQASLIGAAVILPVVAHLSGAPVRYILPMHWPVIIAGLVYGWRGGAMTGFLAPIVSYSLSGFPSPSILPSMTLELLTYGFLTGFLRERTDLSPFLSVAIALLAGRVIFVAAVFFGNVVTTNHLEYFQVALLPGLIAAACQIALLPLLSKWWIRQDRDTGESMRRES